MKAADSAIVKFSLEVWLDAKKVPESERLRIREFAKHSFSCYTENGEHIKHPLDKENLLAVLMGMERYIIDSNLRDSVRDAKKPETEIRLLSLGRRSRMSRRIWKQHLLGHDNSNNNLFDFGYVGEEITWLPSPCFVIHRLDVHQRVTFDGKELRLESRLRAKRKIDDPEFVQQERKHFADVCDLKRLILNEILKWRDVEHLPIAEAAEPKRLELIQAIRLRANSCSAYYPALNEVASLCYAALLLERDGVGRKTREEFGFCDEEGNPKRNLFGDTRLIQNALWLRSRILSKDGAVKRMVDYLDLPEITVSEKI